MGLENLWLWLDRCYSNTVYFLMVNVFSGWANCSFLAIIIHAALFMGYNILPLYDWQHHNGVSSKVSQCGKGKCDLLLLSLLMESLTSESCWAAIDMQVLHFKTMDKGTFFLSDCDDTDTRSLKHPKTFGISVWCQDTQYLVLNDYDTKTKMTDHIVTLSHVNTFFKHV
jgi:hypothetical protein